MPHIGRVNTYLVLPARFQPELHQRIAVPHRHSAEVGYGILPAVVHRTAVGNISLVVAQPVGYGTALLLHLARQQSYVATVIYYVVPIVFQPLLCVHVFGIYHQSAGVAVQPVHHVCRTLLSRLAEIVVEQRLHVERRVSRRHRQYSRFFLYHYEPPVFIDYLHIAAFQRVVVALRLADGNNHTGFQRVVKLRDNLPVNHYAATLQSSLHLSTTLLDVLHEESQQLRLLLHLVFGEFSLFVVIDIFHTDCKSTNIFGKYAIRYNKTYIYFVIQV